MVKLDISQGQSVSIREVVASGATSFFLINPLFPAASVQLLPTAGATVTVHYTETNPAYWGSDGAGAIWEPVGSTYEFTAQETLHFTVPITGVRITSADEATTVDVLGGRG